MRRLYAAAVLALISLSRALAQPAPLELKAPITRWDEAIPLGNGILGGLLWGEGNVIRLSLDRGDLWDERLPEMLTRPDWTYARMRELKASGDHKTHVEMFDVPYDTVPYPTKLPGGRLEISLDPALTSTAFSLDLETAEASVDLGAAKVTVFFNQHAPVAMLRCRGTRIAPDAIRLIRPSGLDKLGYEPALVGSEDLPVANGKTAVLRWMTQRAALGLEYTIAFGLAEESAGQVIAFSIAMTPGGVYDGPDALSQARGAILAALREGYDKAENDNAEWWGRFWETSSISIPDAGLQRQYDLCKYYYGAASSPKAPPIPLQGLWTCDNGDLPPWKGDYHNDLNTQMTYLAYLDAGLFAQGESFLNLNERLLPSYREFARKFYGVPGAVVPGVMTLGGRATGGWGQHSLSPTHSAWVAQSFYLHWRYTADSEFLRTRAYPFCEAVGEAFLALAKPDESGRLRLALSSSPEIYDNSPRAWLPPNSNYDLALLRFMFAANGEMAEALRKDGDARKWRDALARLDAFDVDASTGSLTFARGFPFNESHRHFSHAMAVHPLGLMNIEGPADDAATVRSTLAEIEAKGTRAWCGYSFSWFSAMCARAGMADKALEYLKKYERGFIAPNGFHLNGDQSGTGLSGFTYRPFTLEGNFLAMQAIQEMLLQSWGTVGSPGSSVIRVFPAVSDQWADVSFHDLRAEGGVRVSAERKNGKTVRVCIAAGRDTTMRLRDPFPGRDAVWEGGLAEREGNTYRITLTKGQTICATAP